MSIGTFMPCAKGHSEFDSWWKNWISKVTQNRFVVEPQGRGNEPGSDVKRTADGWCVSPPAKPTPKPGVKQN
jgi:hypothetical protein